MMTQLELLFGPWPTTADTVRQRLALYQSVMAYNAWLRRLNNDALRDMQRAEAARAARGWNGCALPYE